MLTTEDIEVYRTIYRKVHGREISPERALEEGTKLVLLLEAVLK